MGERAPQDCNVRKTGLRDRAASQRYGLDHGQRPRHPLRARLEDGAQDVDLCAAQRRHEDEIAGLEVDVLGEIAVAQQPLEIDRDKVAVADEEASGKVRGLRVHAARRGVDGGATGPGDGVQQRGGAAQGIDSRAAQAAEHPDLFARDGSQGERDNRSFTNEFFQLIPKAVARLGKREPPDVEAGQDVVVDLAVRPHGDGCPAGDIAHHLDFKRVARTEVKDALGRPEHGWIETQFRQNIEVGGHGLWNPRPGNGQRRARAA